MCDPNITLEKLNDPTLYRQIKPNELNNSVNGNILYFAYGDSQIKCQKVIELTNTTIIVFNPIDGRREFVKDTLGQKRFYPSGLKIFIETTPFNKRQNFLKAMAIGERDPYDRSPIYDYLSDPYTQRNVSQYLGGKKYKRKTKSTNRTNKTKRTTKTNRKKRTKRRQTHRKG
jgi:hypothetical protein